MSESFILSLSGGTGGPGGSGQSGGQGGRGGDGLGATLKVEAGTVHIVINHDDREEEKDIPRQNFLNWLSPINFFQRQADIFRVWQEGTGEWLLADPKFQEWKTGSGKTLWCPGIPGAGKTVLASVVVRHLSDERENNNTLGVACIYLNHKEANDHTPPKLLAALWRQLVYGRDVGSIAKNLYMQHQEKGTAPSLKEVLELLSSSLEEFNKVFLVVDAIDEYPHDRRCILLKHLAKMMGPKVNLMVTSRPHVFADPALPNVQTLKIGARPEDIQKYVDAQIDLSPRLHNHVQERPDLQKDIRAKIIGSVHGMFLLAKLHIESLSTRLTVGAVRKALKELPEELSKTYDNAMQRIEAQNEEERRAAFSTLIWVVNAKRPLTVQELQVALAVEPGTQQLDKDYIMSIDTILSVCAGLVIMDEHRNVVRLVHYTTQEYLDSIQAEKFPYAQIAITRTLLTFLAFDGFPDSTWSNWKSCPPPLVWYSQYCLVHAAGQPEDQLKDMITEFLSQAFQWKETLEKAGFLQRWDTPPWNYPDWPSQPSALWIAAAANLVETAKFFLEGATLLQYSENPEIIVASYYGHLQIVNLLIGKAADVNATGGYYGSALQAAAANGQTEIVYILIEKGADINAVGGKYGSSLQAASYGGHTDIVHILIKKGADISAAGGKYGSSLQAAAYRGHAQIICSLLKKDAEYRSLLHAAIAKRHSKIVHILAENGADVNVAGGEYGSPLQAAAFWGYPEIIHILIEKGANINAAGGKYGSSLQAAAYRGHAQIFRFLLEKDAEYRSLLHAAIAKGHSEIVHMLDENGADVNAAGGEYGSPLQAAAFWGYPEIIHMLIEKGANI
ncbi:ankyrin repeat-containing domain protein, partial [Mycena galericulata]